MFSPPLYVVRKFPFRFLINNGFNVQDNMLFRQIRRITGDHRKFNKYIIFVDCKGGRSCKDELRQIIVNGLDIRGQHFECCERSASMVRTSILSFADSFIIDRLNEITAMDIRIDKTVLSKY